MRVFISAAAAGAALVALSGCEDPYTGQVMCWQDNSLTPPEVICVPLRSMHGRAVPEGAYIVDGGDGGGPDTPTPPGPSPQPQPPAPANVIEYTALNIDGTNVAVEVGEDGRVQSSQAGGVNAVAFDSSDPGSGQSTQDVFDEVGDQLEGAGLVNPFN